MKCIILLLRYWSVNINKIESVAKRSRHVCSAVAAPGTEGLSTRGNVKRETRLIQYYEPRLKMTALAEYERRQEKKRYKIILLRPFRICEY